jgi:hypothetical protein
MSPGSNSLLLPRKPGFVSCPTSRLDSMPRNWRSGLDQSRNDFRYDFQNFALRWDQTGCLVAEIAEMESEGLVGRQLDSLASFGEMGRLRYHPQLHQH